MDSSEKRKQLEEELTKSRKPKHTASLSNDLSMELSYSDPVRALRVSAEAEELSARIHFVPGLARSRFSAGMAYFALSKYEEALLAFDQEHDHFRQIKDK